MVRDREMISSSSDTGRRVRDKDTTMKEQQEERSWLLSKREAGCLIGPTLFIDGFIFAFRMPRELADSAPCHYQKECYLCSRGLESIETTGGGFIVSNCCVLHCKNCKGSEARFSLAYSSKSPLWAE